LFKDGFVRCLSFFSFLDLGSSFCALTIDVERLLFYVSVLDMMRWSAGAGMSPKIYGIMGIPNSHVIYRLLDFSSQCYLLSYISSADPNINYQDRVNHFNHDVHLGICSETIDHESRVNPAILECRLRSIRLEPPCSYLNNLFDCILLLQSGIPEIGRL
jgi:hypothetical protein